LPKELGKGRTSRQQLKWQTDLEEKFVLIVRKRRGGKFGKKIVSRPS